MIKILIKRFIPDYTNTDNSAVREKYSVLAGILGILCNCTLFIIKFTIGLLMNSIAIISDAFNNLTDSGSSIFSIIGIKLSNKRPDKEHPFGHGRMEYIISLIVSSIILTVGVELGKTSIKKIFKPQDIKFNITLLIILSLSVFIKLWMYSYNRYMSKCIKSKILKAASVDSINDVLATSAVILSTIVSNIIGYNIDGIVGLFVTFLIIRSGIKIAKDVINVLIGTPPSAQMVKEISDMILHTEGVYGLHDLIIHEYGPGRALASVHAEVPDDINIVKIHESIDLLEQHIMEDLGINIVIHMDPISLNDEKTKNLKNLVKVIINEIDPEFSIHDFRLTDGENRVNLIFDLVVPYDFSSKDKTAVINLINQKVKEADNKCKCVIKIDMAY